jgi:hypothetical protein
MPRKTRPADSPVRGRYGRRNLHLPEMRQLDQPLRVTSGMLIIEVERGAVLIPAGGIWPGLKHLHEEMASLAAPGEISALHGTHWVHLDRADLSDATFAFALALVQAQLMRVGAVKERLARVMDMYGSRAWLVNQTVMGRVVGAARETVTAETNEMIADGWTPPAEDTEGWAP